MFKNWVSGCLLLLFCASHTAFGQDLLQRQVAHDGHTWVSVNSFLRFSDRWGMMADYHHRRREFGQFTSFNFFRIGATYWFSDELRATGGVALLQLAPPFSNRKLTNEYRLHHELTYAHKVGRIRALERLRFDHRWREQFGANGQFEGYQFSTRIRFLYSLSVPIFSGPNAGKKPSLVIADEILVQMGPQVNFNFFEQNRIFIGIRQRLHNDWAFDCGYMYVFQQTNFLNQLNAFHTLRLFFYWTPDFRKQRPMSDDVLPVEKLLVE